ncbi:MAG: hypothetical protein IJI49_03815 [Bacilli bacterium]|nr:hypothetical protein [Bacilli bacterium]
MKVNLKNVCYPKPLLSELVDDYNNNKFEIKFSKNEYDKDKQKLYLVVETVIENPFIIKMIAEEKIAIIMHLEQKTQRELIKLEPNTTTEKEIDLYKYATTEPIEVIGVLYCITDFSIANNDILSEVYKLLDDKITYERGDIIGYSNETSINLPEDKRIGSIFNLIPDRDNTLDDKTFTISLNSDLIQIIMKEDIHEKYISIYKKDQFVKKLMFTNIVYPAIVSAYTEMFLSYDQYKDKKWCITLANKVEKKIKTKSDEIFIKDNYELDKVYMFTNIALGDLFKDSIETYNRRLGE